MGGGLQKGEDVLGLAPVPEYEVAIVGTWPTEVVVVQNVVLVEGCGCVLTGWVVAAAAAVVVTALRVVRGWGRTPTACPHAECARSTAPSGRDSASLSSWSCWSCSSSFTSCSCSCRSFSFLPPSHHPPNHQLVPPHKLATSSPQQSEHLPLPQSDVQQYPICASTLPNYQECLLVHSKDYTRRVPDKQTHLSLNAFQHICSKVPVQVDASHLEETSSLHLCHKELFTHSSTHWMNQPMWVFHLHNTLKSYPSSVTH